MGLFIVNQVEFKDACKVLIAECDTVEAVNSFTPSIKALVQEHRIAINGDDFARHLLKLVAANNRPRAVKLVNVLSDTGLTYAAELLRILVRMAFKLGLLAGFVVFIVWLCGGLG